MEMSPLPTNIHTFIPTSFVVLSHVLGGILGAGIKQEIQEIKVCTLLSFHPSGSTGI